MQAMPLQNAELEGPQRRAEILTPGNPPVALAGPIKPPR